MLNKNRFMRMYWARIYDRFLFLPPGKRHCLFACSCGFIVHKEPPGTHWLKAWLQPRARFVAVGKKLSAFAGKKICLPALGCSLL
jgi:hypothetical protein